MNQEFDTTCIGKSKRKPKEHLESTKKILSQGPNEIPDIKYKISMQEELCTSERRAHTSISPKAMRSVSAMLVAHMTEYSKQRKRACWYSKKELRRIKEENESIVNIMNKIGEIDEEEDSLRGLEWKTRIDLSPAEESPQCGDDRTADTIK